MVCRAEASAHLGGFTLRFEVEDIQLGKKKGCKLAVEAPKGRGPRWAGPLYPKPYILDL